MKFNVNHYVRVCLTDHGRAICAANHAELMRHVVTPWPHKLVEDAEGWSRWQLWVLMNEFGEHIYNGCIAPFDSVIDIEPDGDGPGPTPEPGTLDAMDAVRAMCR